MPAAVIVAPLNQMLSDPTAQAYRDAAGALNSAGSVQEALSAVGVLGRFDAAVANEAEAVLGALPPAIDRTIMAALGSAFDRGVPVTLTWIEDAKIAVRVWEQPSGLHILFMSPNGQSFV
jgi:hypothetical protein